MKTTLSIALCIALGLSLTLTSGCAAQNSPFSQITTASSVSNQEPTAQEKESLEKLLDPSKLVKKAPATFRVKFETTAGDFEVDCTREWAPNAADRFYNMVDAGFFKDIHIFRAVDGFMFQFGIHGNPKVASAWGDANIKDDKPAKAASNIPGTISFAQTGRPDSRSCQIFVNLGNNSFLDQSRGGSTPFFPFGKIRNEAGMTAAAKVNTEYGENQGNVQGEFKTGGNEYIKKKFPNLTVIKSVKFVKVDDK